MPSKKKVTMVGTGARTQIKDAIQQTRNTQGFTVKLFVPHLYKRYHTSYTTFLKVETFYVEAMGFLSSCAKRLS